MREKKEGWSEFGEPWEKLPFVELSGVAESKFELFKFADFSTPHRHSHAEDHIAYTRAYIKMKIFLVLRG